MDDIEKAAIQMFGYSSIPDNDCAEFSVRTTEEEHSPECQY